MKLFGFNITREKASQFALVKTENSTPQSGEKNFNGAIKSLYKSTTAASCVNVWTMTLNEAPIKVREGEQLNDLHPLAQLFKKPNSYQSQSLLFQVVSLYACLGGNAYLHKVRNQLGQVVELHVYSDAQVQPITDGTEYIAGYLYNFNNVKQSIPKTDIVHLRSHIPNPEKTYLGLSPFALIGLSTEAEYALRNMVTTTLQNGGVPTTVFKYSGQGTLGEESVKQLKTQWRERRRESGKESIALLPTNIDVLTHAQDFSSLNVGELWTKSDVEICAAFNVPVVVAQSYAGLQNSTYNNVKEGYKQWTQQTRIPLWNLWEEQIQLSFNNEFPDIDVEFDLSQVQALQPDPNELSNQILAQVTAGILTPTEARAQLGYGEPETKGVAGRVSELSPLVASAVLKTLTINEQRDMVGLPPIDGGDVIPSTQAQTLSEEETNEIIERSKVKSADVWTEQKKVDTWNEYEAEREKAEKEIAKGFAKVARELEETYLKRYSEKDFDFNDWAKKFLLATEKGRTDLIGFVIEKAIEQAGTADSLGETDKDNIFRESVTESASKIVDGVDKIKDELTELLQKNAGRTASELTELIKAKFNTVSNSRAQLIARTTTTSSVSGAQTKTWQTMNKKITDPKKKIVRVWLSSRDKNTRSAHLNLDGTPENEQGKFNVGGEITDRPAGEGLSAKNACNCRCILIPRRAGSI